MGFRFNIKKKKKIIMGLTIHNDYDYIAQRTTLLNHVTFSSKLILKIKNKNDST